MLRIGGYFIWPWVAQISSTWTSVAVHCSLFTFHCSLFTVHCSLDLRYLDLCGSTITDSALTSVAVGLPKLWYMGLVGCESITDKGIKYLLRGCPDLNEIDTEACYGLTREGGRYMRDFLARRLPGQKSRAIPLRHHWN